MDVQPEQSKTPGGMKQLRSSLTSSFAQASSHVCHNSVAWLTMHQWTAALLLLAGIAVLVIKHDKTLDIPRPFQIDLHHILPHEPQKDTRYIARSPHWLRFPRRLSPEDGIFGQDHRKEQEGGHCLSTASGQMPLERTGYAMANIYGYKPFANSIGSLLNKPD